MFRIFSTGAEKFYVHVEAKKLAATSSASDVGGSSEQDDILRKIEEDYFTAVKEAIMEAFPELKSVYAALPIGCYRYIDFF